MSRVVGARTSARCRCHAVVGAPRAAKGQKREERAAWLDENGVLTADEQRLCDDADAAEEMRAALVAWHDAMAAVAHSSTDGYRLAAARRDALEVDLRAIARRLAEEADRGQHPRPAVEALTAALDALDGVP